MSVKKIVYRDFVAGNFPNIIWFGETAFDRPRVQKNARVSFYSLNLRLRR